MLRDDQATAVYKDISILTTTGGNVGSVTLTIIIGLTARVGDCNKDIDNDLRRSRVLETSRAMVGYYLIFVK